MNLELEAGKQLAKVITNDSDVKLSMSETCQCPCTDGNVIKMPMLRPEWDVSSKEALMWWSSLIHECYHHKGSNKTDFKLLKKYNIDTSKFYGMVLNLVIDHNIEHKEYGKLSGADDWMDLFYADSFIKINEKFEKYPEGEKEAQALKALICFDQAMRSQWSGVVNLHMEEGLSSTEAQEMFHTLMDEAQDVYLEMREGGEANLEVCNFLMDLLDMQEQKDGKKSQSEKGKGEESSEGEGDGEGDSSKSDGEGTPTEADGEGGECDSKKLIEMFYDDSGRERDDAKSTLGTSVKLKYDWSNNSTEGYQVCRAEVLKPKYYPPNHRIKEKVLGMLNYSLSDKVKNVLKVLSQVKWSGGYKRGKIHKKAIPRITSGSDRIFRQREQKIILDTAVCVLLDSSGSMHGRDKYIHGQLACCMLNDAMNKVGIPIEVLGFSQTYDGRNSHNEHLVHTVYGKRDTSEDLVESMSGVNLQNNDDGAAIMWAHSRLIRNKAKRKILIVLSDGSPACMQANAMGYTRQVVREIEQKSPVELYGIGIMDDNVKRIYKENRTIESAEQLETALLEVVKSKIIG